MNALYRVGRQLYRLEPNPPNARGCTRCMFRFTSADDGKCDKFHKHCLGKNGVARRVPKALRVPASVTIVECGP